jgi:hypothetical protein
MPETLSHTFAQANSAIDAAKEFGHTYADVFTMDNTREQVMRVHQYCKQLVTDLTAAQAVSGIDTFAVEQWGPGAPGFTNKTNEINAAANAILAWIQQNFPTVRKTMNASMQALGIPPAQQDALRAQMGDNLDYLLTHQVQNSVIVSPLLPASVLAPLVPLLEALEAAATI